MREFFDYLLIELLPFWHEFFVFLAAVSWPVAVLLITYLYKDQVRTLLPRIVRAGPSGVEFLRSEEQDNIGPEPKFLTSVKPSENILRPPAVESVEAPIRADIGNYSPEKVVDHLVTALARERLDRVFSLAYANIFGSQIRFLRDIVGQGGSMSQLDAHKFFEDVRASNELFAEWNLQRYLNFLRHFNFVESDDDLITVTEFGRDFLIFLARYGLSLDRSL